MAGTDEELQKLITALDEKQKEYDNQEHVNIAQQIVVSQYELDENSPLIGILIKNSGIKDKTDCMIISIDREGEAMASFGADTVLQIGDVLWLAGEKEKLEKFEENISK